MRDYDGILEYWRDEREAIQKKTFTKWVNKHLIKVTTEVIDLFEDLKYGSNLISLLEVLSGEFLPRERGRMRVHWLENVRIGLNFLKKRKIKLVNISAEDIVDGNPKLTLGLIWTIILHFELSDIVQHGDTLSFKEKLLRWAQKTTEGYPGVKATDFTQSWRDGLAFNAILHRNRPDLLDYRSCRGRTARDNLENAFHIADKDLGVTRLLDPEDVDTPQPDDKSLITYISSLYELFPEPPEHNPLLDIERIRKKNQKRKKEREKKERIRKIDEYKDHASRLCVWMRESTARLRERNFPNTLQEIKIAQQENNRFRTEEIPPKLHDKQRLASSYKDVLKMANALPYTVRIEEEFKIENIEYQWNKLISAHQERDHNDWGVLGNEKNDWKINSPELNEYLSDKQIIDICCGEWHTLVLTNSGEVYAWGSNSEGQIGNGRSDDYNEYQSIPIKVNGFNDEKVIQISCGLRHSLALTESGRVFSWGSNDFGQLGQNKTEDIVNEPSIVLLSTKIPIKKISCGQSHSLMLSRDAHIYWFGRNGNKKQMTINTNKFINIASHYCHEISIALSVNGIYYVWGNCVKEDIKVPKETEFKSFDEICNHFFRITDKTFNFSNKNKIMLSGIKNAINLQNLMNGKYVKEFEEKDLIGCGSFGIVYKAIERSNGKVYAIKKIAFNDKDIEKVSKELNFITELKCNFVVEFINSWVEDNCIKTGDCIRDNKYKSISYGHPVYNPNNTLLLHIQMEFCLKTFKQLMTELNISQSLDIINFYIFCELFIELLECLNYLHKLKPPLIHRDLKPENILITDGMNGRFVKLCDFGLAVIHKFEDQSHSSRTGSFKYMAPEVFKRHYDMKADVYSLGTILQEFDLEK
jgi:hypothetical protein